MMDDETMDCPLCLERLDETERGFRPCPCGYQICLWCYQDIHEKLQGLCPACRTGYDPAAIPPAMPKLRSGRKSKDKKEKPKPPAAPSTLDLAALAGVRVLQKNLLYVVGLSASAAKEEVLKKKEFFGKYGKLLKVAVNAKQSPACAYLTFKNHTEAAAAIGGMNGAMILGRPIRVSYGTNKYCEAFRQGTPCTKTGCLYLHHVDPNQHVVTKDELALLNTSSTPLQNLPLPCGIQEDWMRALEQVPPFDFAGAMATGMLPISRTDSTASLPPLTRTDSASSLSLTRTDSSSSSSPLLASTSAWGTPMPPASSIPAPLSLPSPSLLPTPINVSSSCCSSANSSSVPSSTTTVGSPAITAQPLKQPLSKVVIPAPSATAKMPVRANGPVLSGPQSSNPLSTSLPKTSAAAVVQSPVPQALLPKPASAATPAPAKPSAVAVVTGQTPSLPPAKPVGPQSAVLPTPKSTTTTASVNSTTPIEPPQAASKGAPKAAQVSKPVTKPTAASIVAAGQPSKAIPTATKPMTVNTASVLQQPLSTTTTTASTKPTTPPSSVVPAPVGSKPTTPTSTSLGSPSKNSAVAATNALTPFSSNALLPTPPVAQQRLMAEKAKGTRPNSKTEVKPRGSFLLAKPVGLLPADPAAETTPTTTTTSTTATAAPTPKGKATPPNARPTPRPATEPPPLSTTTIKPLPSIVTETSPTSAISTPKIPLPTQVPILPNPSSTTTLTTQGLANALFPPRIPPGTSAPPLISSSSFFLQQPAVSLPAPAARASPTQRERKQRWLAEQPGAQSPPSARPQIRLIDKEPIPTPTKLRTAATSPGSPSPSTPSSSTPASPSKLRPVLDSPSASWPKEAPKDPKGAWASAGSFFNDTDLLDADGQKKAGTPAASLWEFPKYTMNNTAGPLLTMPGESARKSLLPSTPPPQAKVSLLPKSAAVSTSLLSSGPSGPYSSLPSKNPAMSPTSLLNNMLFANGSSLSPTASTFDAPHDATSRRSGLDQLSQTGSAKPKWGVPGANNAILRAPDQSQGFASYSIDTSFHAGSRTASPAPSPTSLHYNFNFEASNYYASETEAYKEPDNYSHFSSKPANDLSYNYYNTGLKDYPPPARPEQSSFDHAFPSHYPPASFPYQQSQPQQPQQPPYSQHFQYQQQQASQQQQSQLQRQMQQQLQQQMHLQSPQHMHQGQMHPSEPKTRPPFATKQLQAYPVPPPSVSAPQHLRPTQPLHASHLLAQGQLHQNQLMQQRQQELLQQNQLQQQHLQQQLQQQQMQQIRHQQQAVKPTRPPPGFGF